MFGLLCYIMFCCVAGSEKDVISAEKELLQLASASELSAAAGITAGDCSLQFKVAPPPTTNRPAYKGQYRTLVRYYFNILVAD